MRTTRSIAFFAALVASSPADALWSGPSNDLVYAAPGQTVVVDVLANDTGVLKPRELRIVDGPRHGVAAIKGGKVSYTPVAGFTGADHFTYRVTGSRGSGVATATVVLLSPLVLRGRVVDGAEGVSTVTAAVGGRLFTTTTDVEGRYVLDISESSPGMVILEARGGGDQAHVLLQSILGDSERLRGEIGSDEELTRDENNQVQITSVSTAQARLLRFANSGEPIVDDADLFDARNHLDYTQLLTQAGAVRLAARGGYPLPHGVVDTMALISNPAALAEFLRAVQRDSVVALPNAIAAIVSDRDLLVPVAAADMVGDFALVTDLGSPGAINGRYIQGTRFSLTTTGGSVVTAVPNPDPSVDWSSDGAIADVVPNAPASQEFTRFHPTLGMIRVVDTPELYRLAKLFDGGGRDVIALTHFTGETYPDHPQLPPSTRIATFAQLAIHDDGGLQPLDANGMPGTRTLWVPGPDTRLPSGSSGGSEFFRLYLDGTGERENGTALAWLVDPAGRLVVTLADGGQGIFRMAHEDGQEGIGLLGEWWTATGARSSRYQISAFAGPNALEHDTAQRSWRSGFGIGDSAITPRDDLVFVLDPDRIAWQRLTTASGSTVTPVGWRVANGVLDILSYRDGSNRPVHECPPEDSGCRIVMIRRWRSVNLRSSRIYMIEEFYQDLDGDGVLDLSQQRTNFYDEIERPQLQTAGGATARRTPLRESAD